jgi:hypothetical protein
MQIPENQTTAVKTPYQAPKLEPHGVWQLATGVSLPIGVKLEPLEWNGEL